MILPRRMTLVWLLPVFVALSIAVTLQTTRIAAQGSALPAQTCTQLLTQVTDRLVKDCNDLNGDQACYVNPALQVDFQSAEATQQKPFARPSDVIPLSAIRALRTGALNSDTGEWGVAAFKTRAGKLPSAVNDKLVTFLVFGDTTFTPSADAPKPLPEATACRATTTHPSSLLVRPIAGSPTVQQIPGDSLAEVYTRLPDSKWVFGQVQGKSGWLPAENVKLDCDLSSVPEDDPALPVATSAMSIFNFSTGSTPLTVCSDIPAGGVLIDSPNGRAVQLTANGVNVTLRSTALLQAQRNGAMDVTVLRGEAEVSYQTEKRVVVAGSRLSIPLRDLTVSGPFTPTRQIDLKQEVQGYIGLCRLMWAAKMQSDLCSAIMALNTPSAATGAAPTTGQAGVAVLPNKTVPQATAAPATSKPAATQPPVDTTAQSSLSAVVQGGTGFVVLPSTSADAQARVAEPASGIITGNDGSDQPPLQQAVAAQNQQYEAQSSPQGPVAAAVSAAQNQVNNAQSAASGAAAAVSGAIKQPPIPAPPKLPSVPSIPSIPKLPCVFNCH